MAGTPEQGILYAQNITDTKTLDPSLKSFVTTAKKILNDPMIDVFASIAEENLGYGVHGGMSSNKGAAAAIKYISLMK